MQLDFVGGAGFVGIAVALMGRSHPVGIVPAAILFGMLYQGGAEISFEMPQISRDMITIIQGLVILFAGALENMFRPALTTFFATMGTARAGKTLPAGNRIMEYFDTLIVILQSTVRVSVPLILAALAGLLFRARRASSTSGLKARMLAAAFAGGAAASVYGSALVGLGAAVFVSAVPGPGARLCLHHQRGNQIVSGVAINFIALGATVILGQAWFRQGGRTPQLGAGERFTTVELPFAAELADIPILGSIYSNLLSGHFLLTYFAFALVPFTWWVLYRTRFGLRLRAVGENPGAVDTAGISVIWLRYRAVICCGILCGFAGAYLSMAMTAGFVKGMTCRQGLHRAGRVDLRQVEAGQCHVRLPFVRLSRRHVDPHAGQCAAAHRRGAGPVHAGPALYPDRHPAGRFHRQGNPAARRRRTLCQGTIR